MQHSMATKNISVNKTKRLTFQKLPTPKDRWEGVNYNETSEIIQLWYYVYMIIYHILFTSGSVSYTHLDVYKRQILACSNATGVHKLPLGFIGKSKKPRVSRTLKICLPCQFATETNMDCMCCLLYTSIILMIPL